MLEKKWEIGNGRSSYLNIRACGDDNTTEMIQEHTTMILEDKSSPITLLEHFTSKNLLCSPSLFGRLQSYKWLENDQQPRAVNRLHSMTSISTSSDKLLCWIALESKLLDTLQVHGKFKSDWG